MVNILKGMGAAIALTLSFAGVSAAQEAPVAEAQITTVEALIGELLAAATPADALNAAEASTLTAEEIAFAFGAAAQLSGQDTAGSIQSAYTVWLGGLPATVDQAQLGGQFASGAGSAEQGIAGGGGSGFFGGGAQSGSGGAGAGTGGGGGASPT